MAEEMEKYLADLATFQREQLVFLAAYLAKRLENAVGTEKAAKILERAVQRARRRIEFHV